MSLKEKLLSLDLVVDNEYLDKYVELIESNRETKREKFKTQKHHIIPRYYYKLNKLDVDDSKENVVNLLYKYHFIAHLLLAMCSKNEEYFYNNFIALSYMNNNFSYTELDTLQEEYEECRKRSLKHNPMNIKIHRDAHDEIMRSTEVRTKISNTMKNKIACGEFFTEEHRKNITNAIKDSVYMYKDNQMTRVRTADIQTYLDSGWKKYEKRTYDQLCGREMMTIRDDYQNMFNTRGISCYCIIDNKTKVEFKSIRDATVWWFENYHPFGEHYAECVLQRKIKKSIDGKPITHGNKTNKNYIEITNIKWFKN